jgi:hypothetical protein
MTTISSEAPAKPKRTKEQLTAAILKKAKASGVFEDIGEVIIYGPAWRPNANWDFGIRSKCTRSLFRDECCIELTKIADELQAQFDLGDE